MENQKIKLPPYAKFACILASFSLIVTILYIGQHILIPLLLSLLFAIILRPLVVILNNKLNLPHVIAVLLSVFLFAFFIGAIVFFISFQIADIAHEWVKIQHNFSIHFGNIQQWINQKFHLSYSKQDQYIKQVTQDSLNTGGEMMGSTLNSFTATLLDLVLIPIYTFLILLYRNLFINFLSKLINEKNEHILLDILTQVKTVIQSYVLGLLIETTIVGILTTMGLMLLGVEYAVLLGVITALLNLIPYIGILMAALISIMATLINSTDISIIAGVIAINMVVQFIDNNILVPKIVGNKVRINAMVSIISVILGGAIAGFAGMFLAIPLIAILKVVFDRVDAFKPWGFLMGDDLPLTFEWRKLQLPSFDAGNSNDTGNLKSVPNQNIIIETNSNTNKA